MNVQTALSRVAVPLLVLTTSVIAAGKEEDPERSPIPDAARQLILVSAPAANDFRATLSRFERTDSDAPWRAVSAPTPVVLGPNGLGTGVGLHKDALPLVAKEEGDGKSPGGVFTLGEAFGFQDRLAVTRLPYRVLADSTECVDDVSSAQYNRIVERDGQTPIDWNSSEKMRAIPGYALGIVIEHNPERVGGAGSCIFFHVWSDPDSPTAGCTAMSRGAMVELAEWVDPQKQPVVVQLPESLVDTMSHAWGLPRE